MSTFSPSDAALEGFRLTREHPVAVLMWGGIYAAGIAAMGLVMRLGLGPEFIAFLQNDSLQANDPEMVKKFGVLLSQSWPAFIVVLLIAVAILGILTSGIYRLVLRPDEHGFAHLRLGTDELRVAAAHLLLVGIGFGALMIAEIAVGLAVRLAGVGLLASVFSLVSVAVMIWIGVRLSLTTPLAFAEKRVSLAASWRLTRGKFWRLFGMILLSLLFWFMILVLLLIIAYVLVTLAGGATAVQDVWKNPTIPAVIAFVVAALVQLVWPTIQAVTVYAPFAVAYKQLKASEAVSG